MKTTETLAAVSVFETFSVLRDTHLRPFPLDPALISQFEKRGINTPKGRSKRNKLQWEREGDQDLTVRFLSSSGVGLKPDLIALVD